MKEKHLLRLLVVPVACLRMNSAHAATYNWTGAGTNNNFTNGANWGGTWAEWNDYEFSGTPTTGTVNVDAGKGWGNITLSSGLTKDIVISGSNPIHMAPANSKGWSGVTSLGGTITIASDSKDLTIDSTVNLDGQLVMNVGAGRTLTANGNVQVWSGIGVTASILKKGDGTAVLTGSKSYNGVTVLEGGILNAATFSNYDVAGSLGNRAVNGDGSQNVGILFRGGTLQYTGTTAQSTNRQIRLSTSGGNIDASGSTADATLSFTHSGTNADLFETGGTRALTLTGSNTGNNTFAISLTDQNASSGKTSLVKDGAGKWVLSGASTYGGTTDIKAGTLVAASNTALGIGGLNASTMTKVGSSGGPAATLALQGNVSLDEHMHIWGDGVGGLGALRSLSGDNALTLKDGNGGCLGIDTNITVGVDADKLTVTGFYHDAEAAGSGITKVGNGTLVLSDISRYTGATIVSAGKLLVNGTTATGSAVTVASGASLGGTGTVGGATTIQSGGHLAVGTSPGTQTFSNSLTFDSGSIFDWELNANTSDTGSSNQGTYDKVVANGSVTGTSAFTIALGSNAFTHAFWDTNKSWSDIFGGSGTFTLSSIFTTFGGAGVASNGLVAGQGQFSFTSNTLNWTAVPEPTSALAGLLITAGLLRRRRREC